MGVQEITTCDNCKTQLPPNRKFIILEARESGGLAGAARRRSLHGHYRSRHGVYLDLCKRCWKKIVKAVPAAAGRSRYRRHALR